MKKVLLALLAVFTFVSCGEKQNTTIVEPVTITNPITLNSNAADMKDYKWLNDSEPAFVEITLKESVRMFEEKGSGILYYGYAGCPWCERAVPILNEVAKELGVTIYYINVHAETTMDAYNTLMTYISSILETDSNGEPVFKVPEVIAVKNGEIMDHHLALVDGFKIENDESQMSQEQKDELRNIYHNLISSAKDD